MQRIRTLAGAAVRTQGAHGNQTRFVHARVPFSRRRTTKLKAVKAIENLYSPRNRQGKASRPPLEDLERLLLIADPESLSLDRRDARAAQKYAPIFNLPGVVLDLDAEDSPHVRPFDKEKDALQQQLKWAVEPLLDELKDQALLHHREFTTEAEAMSQAANRPLGPQAISDHDIFTVALLGAQFPPAQGKVKTAPQVVRLHRALRAHGVPQNILYGGPSETIPFMLHRQRLAAQRLNESASLHRDEDNHTDLKSFEYEVQKCKDLSSLREVFPRVVSPTTADHVGSHSLDILCERCIKLYKAPDLEKSSDQPANARLLGFPKFVNNNIIYQLLHNRPLHPGMAVFGLQLASRNGFVPAVLQYLQICLSMGFIDDTPTEKQAAVSLKVAHDILVTLQQTDTIAIGTRQQLLKLLFGVDPDQNQPQPSLLGLNADFDRCENPERHRLRLQLLGQLGALRLLWRFGLETDEAVLVNAFHRFAQLTYGVKGVDVTTMNGDVETDVVSDLRTMNMIDSHRLRVDTYNSASDTSEPNISERLSSKEIIDAFQEKQIGDAMRRFQELIDAL